MHTTVIILWRSSDSDIVTDTASFSETREAAEAYRVNPGFGGRTLYRAEVEMEADRVLDLTADADPTGRIADIIGVPHPGAIGADEYVPRVSYELHDAGYDWIRVLESYPADTITWIWVGGEEPEMEEVK